MGTTDAPSLAFGSISTPRAPRNSWRRNLLRRGGFAFLFLDQRRALAETFAQIGQLGAAHVAFAFDFDLIDPRRVHRKDPFDPLAVTDAPHGEGRVQAASAAANYHAGEDLCAFLVDFVHFC